MYAAVIPRDADETEFRRVARQCLEAGLAPGTVAFVDPAEPSLLPRLSSRERLGAITVPRKFAALLSDAVCHRAADRFALLYEALWRITRGERDLAERSTDATIARLSDYAHNVRRDIHKMHAFLRFRERTVEGEAHFAAWFEPQHYILKRAVPFFVDRFPAMNWLIVTPIGTAIWQNGALSYGPPAAAPIVGDDAVLDELWLTYYRTTFNPARVRVKAMAAQMPKHYWRNMPETSLIPGLVAAAPARIATMGRTRGEEPPQFARRIAERRALVAANPVEPLAQLRREAAACRRCPLHAAATQTVFGDGPQDAPLLFVGEQPGDQEDLAGKPFVGPAGALFDRALAEAGIDRGAVYVTNAVKHFKYEPRGKRRIHKRPNGNEVQACRWWLEREIAAINPLLVVALGATAAQSLARRAISVLRERGPTPLSGRAGFITVHPSFLLRLPGEQQQAQEYEKFVADLRWIRTMIETPAAEGGTGLLV